MQASTSPNPSAASAKRSRERSAPAARPKEARPRMTALDWHPLAVPKIRPMNLASLPPKIHEPLGLAADVPPVASFKINPPKLRANSFRFPQPASCPTPNQPKPGAKAAERLG